MLTYEICNYDFQKIDSDDETYSIFYICTCYNPGFEYCSVIIGDPSKGEDMPFPISLNPNDPIEDIKYVTQEVQKIIDYYINKHGGLEGILTLTQKQYDEYMSPEEREEYHKNDIKKELEKKPI